MNIIFAINTKGYKANQMTGFVLTGNGGDCMDDDELILLIGIGLAALLTLLITLIICL